METDSVKQQVWELADELNAALGNPAIVPHQQKVTKKNISLTGPNSRERLYIKPAREGYFVAIDGNSLVARMEPFMERLTGRERHGYAHPHVNRTPYWYVIDYTQVREAAYEFAQVRIA